MRLTIVQAYVGPSSCRAPRAACRRRDEHLAEDALKTGMISSPLSGERGGTASAGFIAAVGRSALLASTTEISQAPHRNLILTIAGRKQRIADTAPIRRAERRRNAGALKGNSAGGRIWPHDKRPHDAI